MSIRKDLADALRAALPGDWSVYAHGLTLENPLRPVVVVRQMEVNKTAGAPRLYRDAGFVIALVEPGLDLALLEDALDDDVDTVIDALEGLNFPGLIWSGAKRVTFEDRFHGYEIDTTITTERDNP